MMPEPDLTSGPEKAPQLQEAPPEMAFRLSGPGVASLVLGIIGVAFFWFPLFGQLLSILAVIFGAVGIRQARNKTRSGMAVAVAGLVLGIIGLLYL